MYALELLWAGENVMSHPYEPTAEADLAKHRYKFVAELDGRVLGLACGNLKQNDGSSSAVMPEKASYLELEELYVHPEHRQQGIGKSLLRELMAAAKKDGASRALVYSANRDSKAIIDFYALSGFKPWFVRLVAEI
jgi:ribosomal protein S18 acetylase RimI-like enzyme